MCNACQYEWCGKCNVIWHRSKTCNEYQREIREISQKEAEKGLEPYRKWHRIVKCPTCQHGIEKIGGCNHMR